jgi:hypothetical protein
MMRGRIVRVAWFSAYGLVLPAAVLAVASCLIADPGIGLPAIDSPPHILHDQSVPPDTAILTSLGPALTVYVELVDPKAQFEYRLFVDYDPLNKFNNNYGLANSGTSDYDPHFPGNVRQINQSPNFAISPENCHVIEVLVASQFYGPTGQAAHTPKPAVPGQDAPMDSVVWFYNPSGNLAGCPFYDGGSVNLGPADAGDDVMSDSSPFGGDGGGG